MSALIGFAACLFTANRRVQGGYTNFRPHFLHRRCNYNPGSSECAEACLNNGRYCAVDTLEPRFAKQFQGWQVWHTIRLNSRHELDQ